MLRQLLPVDDPAVLVDATTADDAAVYLLDDRALVVTADFFTPIVDDPFDFGRIAAANALSDIYAMGAHPLFALSLVAFPRRFLDRGLLEEIVRGGADVMREAGAAILGGHSIDDPEPKFGFCVVGESRPDGLVLNSTARPGDALVLTKAVGTGIIATALMADAAHPGTVATAVASMTALNAVAAGAMQRHGAHACTDVTGYGLIGHLLELASASGLAARLDPSAVPTLPDATRLARDGHIPGGTRRNLEDADGRVDWRGSAPELRAVLADAQTSGGLLVALSPDRAPALVAELREAEGPGSVAAVVGELVEGEPGTITLVGDAVPGS